MKVEHYPGHRVAKCPGQQIWNWPTACCFKPFDCQGATSRCSQNCSFVKSFEFPILDAGDEDQAETMFAATPLTLRT